MMKPDVTMSATKLVLVATAALVSCAGSLSRHPPQAADKVVREYARALSDGELREAYALMSPEYRQRVGFDAWQKNVTANPQEVGETSRRLGRVRSQADLSALQRQRMYGRPVELVQRSGRYYFGSEPIEFYDQSTPRAALRSFVAAFAHKRYDVVLRLMPEQDKEGVTSENLIRGFGHDQRDEIAKLLSQLRPNLNAPIEVRGEHATLPYAEHRRVQFRKERGSWRIVEPQ